jgi:hypothetical protein
LVFPIIRQPVPGWFGLSSDFGDRLKLPTCGSSLQILRATFPGPRREFTGMNTDRIPNPEKPSEQWGTGEEPMTGPQISYLQTLCREAGEEFDGTLTKAALARLSQSWPRRDRSGSAAAVRGAQAY